MENKVSFLVQVSLPYALGELLVEEMGKHHKVWVPICHRYSSNLKYSALRLRPSSISVLFYAIVVVFTMFYLMFLEWLLFIASRKTPEDGIFVDSFRSVDRWTFLMGLFTMADGLLLWMVAKSCTSWEVIYIDLPHYLKVFYHPFGGAGFFFHPQ